MTDNLPVKYTRTDLENARTKGQLVGWVQAGAVVVGGVLLLKAIGWIPVGAPPSTSHSRLPTPY
jgi:hypothetical protein